MRKGVLIGVLSASLILLGVAFVRIDTIQAHSAGFGEIRPGPTPESTKPMFTDYRGVTIGMKAEAAREKLGKAKESSDEQDYYMFGDGETVQIVYDTDKTVKAISATYMGSNVKPPTPMELFGTEAEAKPDGSVSKMVKYPKANVWISYVKTAGDDPLVMVTVSKL